jgi:hypothetical protein
MSAEMYMRSPHLAVPSPEPSVLRTLEKWMIHREQEFEII